MNSRRTLPVALISPVIIALGVMTYPNAALFGLQADSAADDHGHEHAQDAHAHDETKSQPQEDAHQHDDVHVHDEAEPQHKPDTHQPDDPHDHSAHAHEVDQVIRLDPSVMREFGITVETAVTGELRPGVSLPGEVVLNADGVAHVTPRVPGIARRVFRGVGDHVQRGDVLAELDSRALAEAKGAYLAALARITLAQTNLNREQRLYDSQISSERTYLEAQQALQEATIALQLAEQNLHALGVGHDELEQLTDEPDVDYTRYELTAPLSGVIIERHLVPGEVVTGEPGDPPYVVADLSTVWVNLTVYQKDLGVVRAGQPVRITFGHGIPDATGAIAFVSPVIDEATRTATARVVLDNLHGQWRPGLFVTGHLTLEQASAVVIVPRSALQTVEDEAVVFVQTEAGFEPRHVETGRVDDTHVEIIKGLAPGDRYVAANAFALKAELNRAALEHAGHAH